MRMPQAAIIAILLSSTASVPFAYANPEGGEVVGGAASISETAKKLDVYQHSQRAVIDWRSFNIGVDEHTQFHQPSSNSIVLNRIKDANPSTVMGKLSANGNVILVNPNGVFFGRNSIVDVNGLMATSAGINTQSFMDGSNHFNIPGKPDAAIVTQGLITARDAGLVGLVAPNVINHGIIHARLGRVQLASGDTVVADFYGDGLLKVELTDDNVKSQLVTNDGILAAEGGTVAMTAAAARQTINSLIVAEGELLAPTVEQRGGKIIIAAAGANKTDKKGSGNVLVKASLDTSGHNEGEQGGSIEILGDHISLLNGTILDTSGHGSSVAFQQLGDGTATMTADKQVRSEEDFLNHQDRAGGSIKVGGDYLGQGNTQTAKNLYVDSLVFAFSDALDRGDGGRTVFWADDTTNFNGYVSAKGGIQGGNGGFLETSGKINLAANGFADLTNQLSGYSKGTYLLDPSTITIYGNVDPKFVATDGEIALWNANPALSPLELWLDSNDIDGDGVSEGASESGLVSGVTDCGSAITCVAQWIDKSGKGNNATQATVARRAEFLSNGLNGLGVLKFDGTDDYYTVAYAAGLNPSEITLMSVVQRLGLSQYAGVVGSAHIGPYNGINLNLGPSGNMIAGVTMSNNTFAYTYSYIDALQPRIGGVSHKAGATKVYVDGAQINSANQVLSYAGNNNITIGRAYGNFAGGGYLNGIIPESLIYSKELSNEEFDIIEQYQSAKWGVGLRAPGAASVPADLNAERIAATAHNAGNPNVGYNVFTTRYLERLAGSADLLLQATNSIKLDLQNDILDLTGAGAAGKSITLQTTNGDITDVSGGTIRTTRTGAGAGLNGNISLIAGGAGNINVDTTNLEALNGGQVNLSAGGNVNLLQASALNLGSVSGQNISIRNTGGTSDIALNNSITATSAGDALIIAAGRNLVNASGSLSAANGRWLAYSNSPTDTTGEESLVNGFNRYGCTYVGGCAGGVTIPASGNGLIYSYQPTFTATPSNPSYQYGDAATALSAYSGSFLNALDEAQNIFTGSAVFQTNYTQGDNAGTAYTVTNNGSTLASNLGYLVQYNAVNDTVAKATLNITLAGNYSRLYGSPNPALVLNYSGFKLNEDTSVLDSQPLATTAAQPASSVGEYAITLVAGTDNNYNLVYANPLGSLVVNPVALPSNWERVVYINQTQSNETTVIDSNIIQPVKMNSYFINLSGMNITVEKSLANSLGLNQEKLGKLFH